MKQLTFAVVLLACTGVGLAMRHAISGDSSAAPGRPTQDQLDRAAGLIEPSPIDRPESRRQGPSEGAALSLASGTKEAPASDLVFARIAAECGTHLLDRARRAVDNTQLLHQATLHFQASLGHESGNDPLFAEVRAKLAEIEKLRRRPRDETREKPTPAPKPAPAPAIQSASQKPSELKPPPTPVAVPPKAQNNSAIMVGPDGVPIRQAS
ncbi:MAG: hypothetical protein U0840_28185 [Gemmataceae bacterium]